MASKIKEIMIMLLICLATMLVLSVALYKYIPNKKVVPEVEKYLASEETKDMLEDNIEDKTNNENKDAVLVLTSTDLKNYQRTYDYVPGKSNPFAVYTPTVEGEAGQPEGATSSASGNTLNSKSANNENLKTNVVEEPKNSKYYNESSK